MLAGGKAEYVTNAIVTAGYLEALGILPRYGRSFRLEDERHGGARISIIHERLAERAFGSAESAIGQTLTLGSETYEVVGVLPRSEEPPVLPDVWLPSVSAGNGLNDRARRARARHHGAGRVLSPGAARRASRIDPIVALRSE